ncbi:MAG: MBL fold metallo-hydrolase [Alphaproteobacteria bacterium]|jgi:7,8-dihydropterin-6-yl-methyl-4-(beta-D-ribofuranosyl)aminobenzene 5'-phosphate synthase|nr:MBL fold metallo-hydrolase [Alphaproteobacteria bacterium]
MSLTATSQQPVDRVEVTILLDNSIDVFLASTDEVRRAQLSTAEPWGQRPALIAEHGFSAMVTAHAGGSARRMLFDAGMTTHGLIHNMDMLGLAPEDFECMVLSHGHVDHTQGLIGLVERLDDWQIPIHLHPDAFRKRRTDLPDGNTRHMPNMDRQWLEARGISFVEGRGPTYLLGGTVLATGEIARTSGFERGFPPHKAEVDGAWEPDPDLKDDQALVVNVKGKGLVVVTGCCHAGAINTIRYAQKLTGVDTVHALLGGLHLTGSLFEPIIDETVAELKAIGPKCVMAGHCTGWKAIHHLANEMPESYVPSSVGTTLVVTAA